MITSGTDGESELARLKNELIGNLEALVREAELVYTEVVLPRWGSRENQGFPRTLYGYVMATFSMIDLLSHLRYSDSNQTPRMRKFLHQYVGASREAAAVATQLWRHTLMHTANPRMLIDQASGRTYRWLLHWREHLPREQHMQFQRTDGESILNVGLMYLVEELAAAARRAFADAENSPQLRDRFLRVSKDLSTQKLSL